ncbi:phospholipid-binding lipoprotein MlaA [Kushneria sinocarnis]|uniref:Phospholipid-binding lipoprotein MlaA n=1 Tax=Kushneria sinocarnis TaxID=595502 RepID=A0A420WTH9_9GAMM|nr:VacJ family lipoprotein [Kushneria sinocarnis]RKQ96399.1 phospholipid-binding lipoprotein MlaA [Kushneria sinocarnis]
MKAWSTLAGTLVATSMLAGCAGNQTQGSGNPADPWEGFNRGVFAFNDTLDRYALKPVAQGYDYVTPTPVQQGVGNFFGNLGDVGNTFNSLLQGKLTNAGTSTARFLLNSTLGLGGLLDPASRMGIERHEEDFGQTLASWGVGQGPYLVLPFLGPSTVRATAGLPVDWYSDPVTYLEDDKVRWGLRGLDLIDTRAGYLDQEQLIHGDRYSFIRDTYLQRRQYLLNDGRPGQDPFAEGDIDFDDSDFEGSGSGSQ